MKALLQQTGLYFFLLQRKSDSSCREGTKSLCRQADIFVLFSFSVDLYFILIQLLAQGHQIFLCVLNALNIFSSSRKHQIYFPLTKESRLNFSSDCGQGEVEECGSGKWICL